MPGPDGRVQPKLCKKFKRLSDPNYHNSRVQTETFLLDFAHIFFLLRDQFHCEYFPQIENYSEVE